MIVLFCEKCKNKMEVPDSRSGEIEICPTCKHSNIAHKIGKLLNISKPRVPYNQTDKTPLKANPAPGDVPTFIIVAWLSLGLAFIIICGTSLSAKSSIEQRISEMETRGELSSVYRLRDKSPVSEVICSYSPPLFLTCFAFIGVAYLRNINRTIDLMQRKLISNSNTEKVLLSPKNEINL